MPLSLHVGKAQKILLDALGRTGRAKQLDEVIEILRSQGISAEIARLAAVSLLESGDAVLTRNLGIRVLRQAK